MSSAFIFYWGMTVFFNLPNNYMKASLPQYNELFQFLLFQRWEFFAPPPQHNDYIYYKFYDSKSSAQITFEVLQPLNELKSKKAPFTSEVDYIEYILANSTIGIKDARIEKRKLDKYKAERNGEKFVDDSLKVRHRLASLEEDITNMLQYEILENYGHHVHKTNNLPASFNQFSFILTERDIPKFYFRNDTTFKTVEAIIYSSDTLLLDEKNNTTLISHNTF